MSYLIYVYNLEVNKNIALCAIYMFAYNILSDY